MRMLLLALLGCGDSPREQPLPDATPDTGAPLSGEDMGFQSAAACGECHPKHYDEWRRSMHAYAARSPVFQAMSAKAFRDSAGEVGTFCSRCHSVIGDLEGDPGDVSFDERSPLAREGVTCDVCHTAAHQVDPLGNANLAHEPLGPRWGPYADASDLEHEVARSELLTSSELCGSCHDVYMYPGLDVEQAYTEHAESPAAERGQRCQDCHMSPSPGQAVARVVEPIAETDGMTWPARERSFHGFVGPDYAVVDDFPFPDDLQASAQAQEAYLDLVQQLLEASVRIADASLKLQDGAPLLEVSVESLIDSHRVPTGFTSERQLWLQVEVRDATGALVLESGDLDAWGDLRDAHSWAVHDGSAELDEWLVNYQSENLTLIRQYQDNGQFNGDVEQGVATFPFEAQEILRHSLEPLERRSHSFPIRADAVQPLQATVLLRYRNLPPYVLRALQLDDYVERLHIFTLDQASVSGP